MVTAINCIVGRDRLNWSVINCTERGDGELKMSVQCDEKDYSKNESPPCRTSALSIKIGKDTVEVEVV